mmetsp:Transcript_16551/g.14345  ORF Transcript_16551/g.14345 Transcript_16551/m.14345 type:complete len:155 (-) Transcript_16551:102-566(-)
MILKSHVEKEVYDRHFFTYDASNDDDDDDQNKNQYADSIGTLTADFDQTLQKFILNRIQIKHDTSYNQTKLGMLCNDLKQLYVALTRPRNRIIIYDEDQSKRKFIQNLWSQLGLVETINAQTLKSSGDSTSSNNKNIKSFQSLITETSPKEWKL